MSACRHTSQPEMLRAGLDRARSGRVCPGGRGGTRSGWRAWAPRGTIRAVCRAIRAVRNGGGCRCADGGGCRIRGDLSTFGADISYRPDVARGEVAKAIITLRNGLSVTPAEVIAHCRARIGGRKAPHYVEVWSSLPMLAAGKIDKQALRRLALPPLEQNIQRC